MGAIGHPCPWGCGAVVQPMSASSRADIPRAGVAVSPTVGVEAGAHDAPASLGREIARPAGHPLPAGGHRSAPGVAADREAVAARETEGRLPGLTLARTTDPTTAHEAAGKAHHTAAGDRVLVLLAHAAVSERGLTGEELATATGRPYESVGPRRPALEAEGLLVKARDADGLVRRPNARGNPQQVYRCTPAGHAAAARLRKGAA